MKNLLIVIGFIVVLGIIAIIAKKLKTFGKRKLPYCKRDLLSPAELNFFRVISQVIGDEYLITFKVRLADILAVCPGTKEHQTAQNKINCKHVDFLICNKKDRSVTNAVPKWYCELRRKAPMPGTASGDAVSTSTVRR